jgi:hypothetical protein
MSSIFSIVVHIIVASVITVHRHLAMSPAHLSRQLGSGATTI